MSAVMRPLETATNRYADIIAASKAVRWDIDADVLRGRQFNRTRKFLPDSLSLAHEFRTLSEPERVFVSQIQGRTYASVFGLVERFITAKQLEVGREHAMGDQNALEALIRFSDEEVKHQALFRRIEGMMAQTMPDGYRFDVDADVVARAVLGKSTWAVLLLTLHIELFVQNHYRESIADEGDLSELFRDVFLFHWKDECQHVVLDEMELRRHDDLLTVGQRDEAVNDFLALVAAVDGILKMQAKSDADYFTRQCGRSVSGEEAAVLVAHFLKAYRWQYIFSGAGHPRFQRIATSLLSPAQMERIGEALATLRSPRG